MRKLKARFVNRRWIEHGRFRHLKDLVGGRLIIGAFRQRESVDTTVLQQVVIVTVACHQGVLCVDRVIEARTKVREALRQNNALTNLNNIQRRIQNCGPDDPVIVRFVAIEFQKV